MAISFCPLDNTEENQKDRRNPKNPEIALCFQLHDTLKTALVVAKTRPENFDQMMRHLENQIAIWRQKRK
ncbi:MAG: hypothetical protein M3209_09395 [Acidobacteriota bacterium]|nr:hypothetical protein [Acidobacteriota bacterium]